ncbi:maltose alpha-D-glucosyltransferase [Chryseosolibacter indicus]|uniref:Maltokinase n=1 Tax=Chryseosolibacter indicus TaxID=2782351 RepID=A0ABS5VK60_9BACT|nr:maltose alpha-D-glucosyltransferase [Chryseosolibacter indicus]MBT1701818.1 maltose alpha-D-glucosyltransferase [Chryseosolibacter indicus]
MNGTPKNAEALWFKDAIIYEIHVRAFYDSNGDGIGDFPGLIQKLDYLEDLGINTIWLLPFYPSPLKDDGYDVTDYYDVHPDYGNLSDFKLFLKEAHRRGIRVITELILNHTSDQHPWFKKAKRSKAGSRFRDFYVWSDSPDRYKEARVIFSDDESTNWTYDTEAKAYYWHRYYRYQPELNYENAEVQLEMIKIADFWLKMGVDGFRLPSITFLYEQEGTNCENLPQTHAFLKRLRAHIDKHYKNRILIAEANLWPEDAATYFGNGEECHMNFHYPLMPRLFLALRTEDSYPIVDIMEQTPATPPNSQWAVFLRNHDELGLEMVTEEEKDYLFKAYANDPNTKFNLGIRRRLAPLLNNDRRKIELLHTILFSLPGTPVLYYGDEIGMGDNVYLGDRFGVRTPMQWSMNVNAGFSSTNPQRLFLPVITDPIYRYESVNVATQEENPSSLLWWLKNVIAMRKRLSIFGRGDIKFIESTNAKVLAFARSHEKQRIIVVANLSQFSQAATLNLGEYKDCEITEVFSQNRFMPVEEADYNITIGPYGYFWFQVDREEKRDKTEASGELPLLKTDISWERLFDNYNEVRFFERKVLGLFMKKCRWFGGKAKVINKISIHKVIPWKVDGDTHFLTILEVHYVQRLPELYFLPLTFVLSDSILERVEYTVQSVVCRAEIQGKAGFIMDSCYDKSFRDCLFLSMEKETRVKDDEGGALEFNSGVFAKISGNKAVDSKILKSDQSNTAIIYNDQYFFKFYRKLEKEINPDLEIVRFLTEHTTFQNCPKYAGSVEYHDSDGKILVLGLLQEKVDNQGEAWGMAVDSVGRYYERVITKAKNLKLPKLLHKHAIKFEEAPELIQEFIGRGFYERVVRLGQRTAEMHLALASDSSNAAFAAESFTPNYQRSLYSSLRKLVRDRFNLLENSMSKLTQEAQELAKKVLPLEETILQCFSEIYQVKINATKTRIHGDFHLGQVLFTGKDFVIIDFEGEPGLSFNERRLKKNAFKDVAGMMRSFHYAAFGKLLLNENYRDRDLTLLEQAAEQWQHYVGRFYLGAYMERMGMGTNLSEEQDILVRTFLIEKAIYELGYELNGRPEWTIIPLRGILYHVNRYIQEKEEKKKK